MKTPVRQLKNQAGFSLIELMIVVAIIGILASIAVPNFQKFQRRAKQSEGKGYLSGIYSAEQGFRAEWNSYSSDLVCIGFKDDTIGAPANGLAGRGNYIAGFAADGGLLAAPTTCAAGKNTANPIFNAGITTVPTLSAGAVTATTFTAQVVGNLNETSPQDRWTINNVKDVQNTLSGL